MSEKKMTLDQAIGYLDASLLFCDEDAWEVVKAHLTTQAVVTNPDGMVLVTQEDGNNYCRIVSLLGMEEEGDVVAAVEALLSQPHPQAAQGGEADPRVESDSAEDIAQWLYANGYHKAASTVRGQLDIRNARIRQLEAERAAVPTSVQRAIERCLLSEESFADRIDKENPGDNYASLLVREDIQVVRDWLSAAPTLAGKEKG